MSTKRKALIFLIVITVLIIVVMGSISLINANKRAEVGALLAGKTYSGKCYGRYYSCELEITFISETHCNVKELEPYGEGWCYYNNIPYILDGGINGVTLRFRDRELFISGYSGPRLPFRVEVYGNEIPRLHTPAYDSDISLTLKLKK